ncbi:MAG TPA: NAD-dependent epimerase/dehydratase family protein [Gemmataceae bacterium]
MSDPFPTVVESVDHLEELLSEPTPGVAEAMARLGGDILVLGAGGKMGPTLARMARRASDQAGVRRRVVAVARFSEPGLEGRLRAHGVETVRCDLLDPEQLGRLPDAPNVVFMTGMKFGTSGQASLTWAMNTLLPGMVCRKFRDSRVVAFSTGNVYGLTPVALGGSVEGDPPRPVGEYAMSALGRERAFEHGSRTFGTPTALLRLNYATELRYGVLVDLALRVWRGEPVPLAMGHLNALWQGDANAWALQSFDHVASPPLVLNLAGPELLSVRRAAAEFGEIFGKKVTFEGSESADAFLSNSQKAVRLFGYPRVGPRRMVEWIADWVRRGGANLGKPTHFENRAGEY